MTKTQLAAVMDAMLGTVSGMNSLTLTAWQRQN